MSQVQAIQNAASAKVYGLQAGIELKLHRDFDFSANYNYQKGEEELDNGNISPSRHAAPAFAIFRLTYSSSNDIKVQLYAIVADEKSHEEMPEEEKSKMYLYNLDENQNPYSPSWYTLNFKVMKKIDKNFTISGGVENITDRRYRPYSSGIVAPGRNFILSLSAHF